MAHDEMEFDPEDYDPEDEGPSSPYWRCEECGYEDHRKAMPKAREKFYQNRKARICTRCRSESFMPVGF